MGKMSKILQGLKPAMVMVVVQTAFAGMNVLYKFAANDGMSLRIITAYRFVFAVPVMVPLALLVERFGFSFSFLILSFLIHFFVYTLNYFMHDVKRDFFFGNYL